MSRVPVVIGRAGVVLLALAVTTSLGTSVLPSQASEPKAASQAQAAAVWAVRDVGTLPGHVSSEAGGVGSGVVVGTSSAADQSSRAFAYNVGTRTMRDLGTLGGDSSGATAVAGGTVVGWSDTADGEQHAFAYDLAASRMTDLGTLAGGRWSSALAIDGPLVVGWSSGETFSSHPFVYDLRDPGAMRDLGVLPGGSFGRAEDVDGSRVVGSSSTAQGGEHAFVVDLAGGAMSDLGTLPGGEASWAYGIEGTRVVGSSLATVGAQGFVYDLGTQRMRGVGTLQLGDRSTAYAVDAGLVVGRANRYVDYDSFYWHAVVVPVTGGTLVELPGLPGAFGGEAVAVDGGFVAGTASTPAGTRAVLWTRRPAVNGPAPVVVGKAKVGSTLVARRGTWTPSGVRLSQRWLRDGRVIRGATAVRYRLVKADRGHRISVAVTGSRAGWVSLTRTSKQTVRIR